MNLQESTTGFYYVGTKRANITKLVNIYKRGYASGKFNQAMTELSKKEIQPEVICCDSGYGFKAIKQLAGLISGDEKLSRIPLIVDADRKTTVINFQFIYNRIVDDILNLREWDENRLSSKIRFLQKLKSQNRELKQKEEPIKMIAVRIQIFLKKSLDTLFGRPGRQVYKKQIQND